MRFFDTNVLARTQGGTYTATTGNASVVFSETIESTYQSIGQGTNGDEVIINRAYTSPKKFDSLVILDTNFANQSIWTKETDVSSFVDITPTGDNVVISNDLKSVYYTFDTIQTFVEMEIRVSNTLPINEEKYCGCIMAFEEIGNLIIFNDINTVRKPTQKKLSLDSGGVVTVNKGFHWQFKISSKYIGVQEQYDIIQFIQNMGRDFFIWINAGYDSAKVEVAPYRFTDFIKCTHTGSPSPSAHKNYLNGVFDDGITFEQTGQLK
jgi:hypothetical protein